MSTRLSDIIVAAFLGLFVGMCVTVVLAEHLSLSVPLALFVIVFTAVGAAAAISCAQIVTPLFSPAVQIIRFCIVGAQSTLIELAILNILFANTGISSGIAYSYFKALSFVIAFFNSYLLNKYWTFGIRHTHVARELKGFFVVNAIGLCLNVGTASLVVNGLGAPKGIADILWANVGAVVAVLVTMIWNFFAYRIFVFRAQV